MKKIIICLFIVFIIIGLFYSITDSQTINVKDYIKDKFPSIFNFYLSSLEDLDSYEKEFIDLLEKFPEEEQEYYAKEVYKNGFSLELLKSIKGGKTIKVPTSTPTLPSLPAHKEKPIESLPSLIKRIEPSTVIVFTYDNKGEFLCQGSGFFISQNGDIITNYHIFERAKSAEVKTPDGKIYSVPRIVAVDNQSDIIRISIDIASPYVYPLPLCTTFPEVGERIIVYGSPLGLEKTVSDGIVSAIREVPDYGEVIQITAPVSPGSSGSPVLNMNGEVIGVATFQMVKGQNLNFAIPSEKIINLKSKEEKRKEGKTIFTTIEVFWGESPVLVWQENKEKKDSDHALVKPTKPTKLKKPKKVVQDYFLAINDQNWSKAKSYCVYGSDRYYATCDLEDGINDLYPSIVIIICYANIYNVTITGNYAEVYLDLTFLLITDNIVIDESASIGWYLKKVGNVWKLY